MLVMSIACDFQDIREWWDSLPKPLQDEWLAIDWAWRLSSGAANRKQREAVARDWIEEHGGRPSWWVWMNASDVSPSAYEQQRATR